MSLATTSTPSATDAARLDGTCPHELDDPAPAAPDAPPIPVHAPGLELLGEYQGSGSSRPPCLVRRGDGQVVQLSRLTYLVAEAVDGHRTVEELAAVVTASSGREVDADAVAFLLERKLAPLGLVTARGHQTPAPTADPLLSLRGRATLVGPRATNVMAQVLGPLFRTPVVVASLVALASLDVWLFLLHGLSAAVGAVLVDPATLLVVFAVSVVASVFHECGHASACRYGGARPGVIGVGVYIIWPAFFTNVTDSYRLGRAGRLRTDLGGLYFHALFVLGLGGLYLATGAEWLILAVAFIHLEMLEQLLPFVRFDGYFVLSDLVGVPDLFAKITPILRGALRRSGPDPRVGDLKRWVRVAVTAWVLLVVPLLALNLSVLLVNLPTIEGALVHSAGDQARELTRAVTTAHPAVATLSVINLLLLALSMGGTLYILVLTGRRAVTGALAWSRGHRRRRVTVVAMGSALAAALLVTWAVKVAALLPG